MLVLEAYNNRFVQILIVSTQISYAPGGDYFVTRCLPSLNKAYIFVHTYIRTGEIGTAKEKQMGEERTSESGI